MSDQSVFDVLVFGAGAAGLTAARDLTRAGLRVALIEARDRTGGRVWTRRPHDSALPIELGAEFIHGEACPTLAITDSASLIVDELPDNHWWSDSSRLRLIEDYWDRMTSLRKRIPATDSRSFADFLRSVRGLSSSVRKLATAFVEGYHAADAERISAASLKATDEESTGTNRQFRVVGGYDRVIESLRAAIVPDRCATHLSTVLREVQWAKGRVTALCRAPSGHSTSFRGSAAVVTLPVGVLKAPPESDGGVQFVPGLTAKTQALAGLDSGHVIKMILRFRKAFWDTPGFLDERSASKHRGGGRPLHFVHADDPFIPTWWTSAPARSSYLTAWSGGPRADRLRSEASMIGCALDRLSASFHVDRASVDSLLQSWQWHDWQSDPFSRGAYSYSLVGGADAHDRLARPLARTLFFAGEATSSDETGTVSGAISSGIRAAREVIQTLRR